MESNSICSKEKNIVKTPQELDADDTEEVKDPSPSKEKYDKYMQELVANDTEEVKGPRPRVIDFLSPEIHHHLFEKPIKDSLNNLKRIEKVDYAVLCLRCAEEAISYLNASCKNAEGGTEYERVGTLPVASLPFFTTNGEKLYHANFNAKLKNDPEAKPELFFAELVRTEQGDPHVKLCVSLGPSDSESAATGLNGCGVCTKIHHPTSGGFVVSGCSSTFPRPLRLNKNPSPTHTKKDSSSL